MCVFLRQAVGASVLLLAACAPALDWREVVLADAGLAASFPCRPHANTATVPLGGADVALTMHTCKAADATFAVGHARLQAGVLPGPVLEQWRQAVLGGMHLQVRDSAAFTLPRAGTIPQAVRLHADGKAPDGGPLALDAAWFARGTDVYVAMAYAGRLPPEASAPFLAGLQLR